MIIDIPNVGEVEFPDSMSEKEINAVSKRLYEQSVPKEEKGTARRLAEIATRGAAQSIPGAMAGGAIAGPPGALVGSMALPIGDALNSFINMIAGGAEKVTGAELGRLAMPSQVASDYMTRAGLAKPESRGERMVEAGAGAIGSTLSQLPALARMGATATPSVTREVSKQLATAPIAQTVVSAPSAMAAQYATEVTGSPLAGLVAGTVVGASGGVKLNKKAKNVAMTADQLAQESANLFTKAKDSGVIFDSTLFNGQMAKIQKDLRQEGFTPKAYPKIASALEEAQNPTVAKDFIELNSIRKMIKGAQASADPAERRLASILVDEFDDTILNAPKGSIIGGDKQSFNLWEDARSSYSKMKKAEVFETMLVNAELDKSKFTASGAENSMAQQLRQLAKNDKKMRLFTKDERSAIKEAAKGSAPQNLLKFFGRFAPTGPITGALAGGASYANPYIGIPLAAGAAASRAGATSMRQTSIENLIEQMRLGAPPELIPRTLNAPVTGFRGLLATENQVE
jgi:surface antigen